MYYITGLIIYIVLFPSCDPRPGGDLHEYGTEAEPFWSTERHRSSPQGEHHASMYVHTTHTQHHTTIVPYSVLLVLHKQ